jgi:hypothetical protein
MIGIFNMGVSIKHKNKKNVLMQACFYCLHLMGTLWEAIVAADEKCRNTG